MGEEVVYEAMKKAWKVAKEMVLAAHFDIASWDAGASEQDGRVALSRMMMAAGEFWCHMGLLVGADPTISGERRIEYGEITADILSFAQEFVSFVDDDPKLQEYLSG